MSREARIDLFCEDRGHEQFLRYLVARVCGELHGAPRLAVISARGGRGKTLSELANYQRILRSAARPVPDLLVVGIDANCEKLTAVRKKAAETIDTALIPRSAIACADPHVERWYLADAVAFHEVVGCTPDVPREKCERDFYKKLLAGTVAQAGHPPTLGGIEFAQELVEHMDLHRASGNDASLKHFLDELRASLRDVLGGS
jgi:hypothetical protein